MTRRLLMTDRPNAIALALLAATLVSTTASAVPDQKSHTACFTSNG
jgi:hypothetical protein